MYQSPQIKTKFKKYFFLYVTILLILGSFVAGLSLGRTEIIRKNAVPEIQREIFLKHTENQVEELDFQLFWDVWDLIGKKYIKKPVDYQKMFYGAISGMVKALGDPYTVFMDPETSLKFQEEIKGNFEGIGAEIGIKNDKLTIVAPLEGSPAQRAGLKAKDIILKIDDKDSNDLSLIEAVNLIRGEKGTNVTLSIFREGWDKPKEITITRETIEVKSVNWEMKGDVAYIELLFFGEETSKDFKKAVTEILTKNPKGIVLDLRNNAGGYLNSAVEIISEFVEKDKVAVIEEFSNEKRNEFKTLGNNRLANLPVIVLVNEGSASASEILAGALKEHKEALLVGKKTFGKGTVQELEDLSQGSSIRISIAKWLMPNGQDIDEKGIEPDIDVNLTEEDYNSDKDPQLDKALEIMLEKIK